MIARHRPVERASASVSASVTTPGSAGTPEGSRPTVGFYDTGEEAQRMLDAVAVVAAREDVPLTSGNTVRGYVQRFRPARAARNPRRPERPQPMEDAHRDGGLHRLAARQGRS